MIKNNFNTTYYHGTFLRKAVDALSTGEPLQSLRPIGISNHTRSEPGAVYLTPSLNQAIEYAHMLDRGDWPGIESSDITSPHVFAFKAVGAFVRPEEDELGYAVKVALHSRLRQKTHWCMNSEFAQNIHDANDVQDELFDLALRLKLKQEWIDFPSKIDGKSRTKIGLKLLPIMPDSLERRIVDMGISIATKDELYPYAGYRINLGPRIIENMTEVQIETQNGLPSLLRSQV